MDTSIDAEVRGRCIRFRWDPDPKGTEQNVWLGLAMALAPGRTAAEICRLARLLGEPGRPGLRACRSA